MPQDDNNMDFSAKKPKNSPDDKKGKGGIIAIVVVLVLVVGFALVLVLDIGNVRSEHIAGYLRGAPLVGRFFPEPEYDPVEEMTEEEMRMEIHVLNDHVASLEARLFEANAMIAGQREQIAHLSLFRDRWQEYREASAAFTQMLAHNAAAEFVEFFERIVNHDLVPQDILALAFAEAQAIALSDEELMGLVRTYNAMEESRVAENLERMLVTQPDLAVRMLRAMSPSRRGAVFDEMDEAASVTFTILLSTAPPTFLPLVPPPYLPEILPPIVIPTPPQPEEDEEEYEENGEEYEDSEYDEE